MDKLASYENIFNNLSDHIARLDTDIRYVTVNPSYSRALGLEPEEIVGKTPRDFFDEEFYNNTILPRAEQCLSGEKVSYKAWFDFPALGKRYIDVMLHPVFDDQRNITGYIYQSTDITDSFEQLKKIEDYELALENAMQGISRLDANGFFEMVSDEYARMLGYTSEELVGQSWAVTVPAEDQPAGLQAFEVMLRDGQVEHESLALRKDGSVFYKQLLLVQIKDDSGKHTGHYCFMRDITERREAELQLRENEHRLQEIISATNVGTWEWNIEKHEVTLSQRWAAIAGYELEELQVVTEKWWKDFIYPNDRELSERLLNEHLNRGSEYYECECRVVHKSGKPVWVTERGQVVEWSEDGKPLRMSGTLTDISRSKMAEEELTKLSRAVDSSNAAIIMTNNRGIIEYVNPGFVRNYGYNKEEVIGRSIDLLRSKEIAPAVYQTMRDQIQNGYEWKGTLPHVRKNGFVQQDRVVISSVKNHINEITHYVSIHQDMTHEYELSKKLSFQASHDALTGIFNRREFERRANRLIATSRTSGSVHALCFLDLDQFKIVNDTCGHVAGDELLRQVSTLLREQIREGDTLARLGGDEFALLMEHCKLEQAQRVVNNILDALQEYQFSWSDHVFRIGASIGLVAVDSYIEDFTELMKHADASCYAAKELGRNRYHIFNPDDETLAQRHGEMRWVTRIYSALENDDFCLYAQRIDAMNRLVTDHHYELLIRLQESDGQIYPPGSFLPAAERYNLIEKIDRWVICKVFETLKDRHDFLAHINFLSINISGPSLTDETFLSFIKEKLSKFPHMASKICFEITETAAIANLTTARQTISELKALGSKFALDDFGSGLSSFAYLKNLPVDYIKIDGMFVRDIAEDPIDHAMVRSINEIAQVIGMQTIAEFVETDEIKGMLREIGVNYAQGYGIDKPKPLKQVLMEAAETNVVAINS